MLDQEVKVILYSKTKKNYRNSLNLVNQRLENGEILLYFFTEYLRNFFNLCIFKLVELSIDYMFEYII